MNGYSISKVHAEFGIYDNYRILLYGQIFDVKEILQNSATFKFDKNIVFKGSEYFSYGPGIMMARLFEGPWSNFEKGYKQMIEDYNLTITLHFNQKKDMSDITQAEARLLGTKKSNMAIVRSLRDLTDILITNKIPFCLPESARDYSKMVKYTPPTE
jgi:hypothetical protein